MNIIFAKALFDGDATTWSGQEGIKNAEIIQWPVAHLRCDQQERVCCGV